jgi:hypothetical protein
MAEPGESASAGSQLGKAPSEGATSQASDEYDADGMFAEYADEEDGGALGSDTGGDDSDGDGAAPAAGTPAALMPQRALLQSDVDGALGDLDIADLRVSTLPQP